MVVLSGCLCPIGSAQGDSLGITVEVDPGPVFVGQVVSIRVRTSGAGSEPVLVPPEVPGVDIRAIEPGPSLSEGADRSAAQTRFKLIPGRVGILDVPPFRVRSGGRTASSRPIRLSVLGIPSTGRTATFLGGVGPFEVRGEVDSARVRVGQILEFRLRVGGDAAWGSFRGPDLAPWARSMAIRVEPVPGDEFDPKGPSRSFRYRIRPTRSGRITLPPVAVSAFDPTARRFATRTTAGIPIEVEGSARFDPSRFRYGGPPGEVASGPRTGYWSVAGILIATFAATITYRLRRKVLRSRDRGLVNERASALAERLEPSADPVDSARRITAGLAELLLLGVGRPTGVLTPPEARSAFGKLTGDDEVGDRSGRLIARCDRAIYGKDRPASAELVAEARGLLEEIRRALPAGKPGGRWTWGGRRDRVG